MTTKTEVNSEVPKLKEGLLESYKEVEAEKKRLEINFLFGKMPIFFKFNK